MTSTTETREVEQEMARYIITIAYDGSAFQGWQIQPDGTTVQGTIEHCLSTMLQRPLSVTGAGRTDTGVHASAMVAHLDFPKEKEKELITLIFRLNRFLPREIRITSLRAVAPTFHARFSAETRQYGYYITQKESPFDRYFYTPIPSPMDFNKMNEAARHLIGTHDFTTFSKGRTDVHTHICTVSHAEWIALSPEQGHYKFLYVSNRFLRNMVRATVGTLLEVGKGRMTPEEFRQRLEAKDRALAGTSAPPMGLFLEEVQYPEELLLEELWHS